MVFSRRKGTSTGATNPIVSKAPIPTGRNAGNASTTAATTTKHRSVGNYAEDDSSPPSAPPSSDEEMMLSNSNPIRPLASFDACVETVDTMAAASTFGFGIIAADNLWRRTATDTPNTAHTGREDNDIDDNDTLKNPSTTTTTHSNSSSNNSKIDDCSVCVSPDGLIITNAAMVIGDTYDLDLDSSIVVGYDGPGNDRALNGFSARGWSTAATSHSLRQCVDALQATGRFADSICKAKEQCAINIRDASRKLFDDIWDSAAFSPKTTFLSNNSNNKKKYSTISNSTPGTTTTANALENQQQLLQEQKYDYNTEIKGRDGTVKRAMRMGPLLQPGTTLHQALTAVEACYSKLSLIECNRWRTPYTTSSNGSNTQQYSTNLDSNKVVLPSAAAAADGVGGSAVVSSVMAAAQRTQSRGEKRELALQEAIARAEDAEARLNRRKADASRKWAMYHDATNLVRERLAELEKERELERQKEKEKERRIARQDMMKEKFVTSMVNMTQPMQKDVLQLVSQVVENADFAPTTKANAELNPIGVSTAIAPPTSSRTTSPSVFLIDKAELELKYGVAEKRLAALEADNAVEDSAGVLLNALSSVDTTKRSARIAAEACLLSAANKQKQTLAALIKVEKDALLDQLRAIEKLEEEVENIDVRADLNLYIEHDKQYPGGRTEGFRDDNDDGGIASALAVLNCHSFSTTVNGLSVKRGSVLEGWGSEEEDGIVGREEIEDCIDTLFKGEATKEGIEAAISFLVNAVKDPCEISRTHRAYVCYALNAKRSEQTELKGKMQFDGLCEVISALLSACSSSSGDIANSKMCMILSQTFFMVKSSEEKSPPQDSSDSSPPSEESIDRRQRIFVKSRLIGHRLWNDDDFWDHALYQCISEALTQSEVMHNLQRAAIAFHTGSLDDVDDESLRKVKWHDFPPEQRSEAAAQLHSVVFAQLGALSHSMIELGCSFTKAVAFVRRSAVRHQLPISQRTTLLQHLEESISEKAT